MKYIKQIIATILITVMMLYTILNATVVYAKSNRVENIKIFACDINNSESSYDEIINMLSMIEIASMEDNVKIGQPIFVYNYIDKLFEYTYPIFINGECEYVANMDNLHNLTISEDTKLYDGLDSIEKNGETYVVYNWDGEYFAQSNKRTIELKTGELIESRDIQVEIEYKIVQYKFQKGQLKEVVLRNLLSTNYTSRSVTSITQSNRNIYMCTLKDFVTQNNKNLCWAASVATIVNYKCGALITAEMVADKIGIPYDKGAKVDDIIWALHRYGLDYKYIIGKEDWQILKSEIASDNPFIILLFHKAVGTSDVDSMHAITAYGYSCAPIDNNLSMRFIYAWDSNGYKFYFQYNSSVIRTSGRAYTWYYSMYSL